MITFLFLLALLAALLAALAASDVRRAWDARVRRAGCPCPSCARHAAHSECERCELFRCAGCAEWVGWDDGAADDMPEHCSRCWCDAHGAAS